MKKTGFIIPTIFIFSFFLNSCYQVPDKLIENGVSKALSNQRKDAVSELSYSIELDIPKTKEEAIKGNIDIHLIYNDNKNPLIIDFREEIQKVINVQVNGKQVNYKFKNHHIIVPAKELTKEKDIISVEFIAGNLSLNRNDEYLYTLFVPDRASTAFPCFDQPNLKAKYTLTLTIPENWKAKTNSPIISEEIIENRKTIHFKESSPLGQAA